MSVAIDHAVEELLLTAFARMTAELKAETDPKRLETLFNLALRAPYAARRSRPDPENKRAAYRPASTPTSRPPRAPDPSDLLAPTGRQGIATGGATSRVAEPVNASGQAPEPQRGDRADAPAATSTRDDDTARPTTAKAPPILAAAGPGVPCAGRRSRPEPEDKFAEHRSASPSFGERLTNAPSAQSAPAASTTPDQPAPSSSANPQSEIPNPQSIAPAPAAPGDSSPVAHQTSPSPAELRRQLLQTPINELFKDEIAALAAHMAELRAAKAPGPYVYATEYLVNEGCVSHPQNADGTLQPLVEIPPGVRRPTDLERIVFAVRHANYCQKLYESNRKWEDAKAARAAREATASKRRQRSPTNRA